MSRRARGCRGLEDGHVVLFVDLLVARDHGQQVDQVRVAVDAEDLGLHHLGGRALVPHRGVEHRQVRQLADVEHRVEEAHRVDARDAVGHQQRHQQAGQVFHVAGHLQHDQDRRSRLRDDPREGSCPRDGQHAPVHDHAQLVVAEFWSPKSTCERSPDDAAEHDCRREDSVRHRRGHHEEKQDDADHCTADQKSQRVAIIPDAAGLVGGQTFTVEEVAHDQFVADPECRMEVSQQGHEQRGERRIQVPTV
jgi:hypothetical protein